MTPSLIMQETDLSPNSVSDGVSASALVDYPLLTFVLSKTGS
jgi:hypothetical protein